MNEYELMRLLSELLFIYSIVILKNIIESSICYFLFIEYLTILFYNYLIIFIDVKIFVNIEAFVD